MAYERALAFSKAAAKANQCVRQSQHGKIPVQRGDGLLACRVISRFLCSNAQRKSSSRRICMAWLLECVVRPAIVLPNSNSTIKPCGQRLHCLSLTTPSTRSFHVLALRNSHGMRLAPRNGPCSGSVVLGFGVAEVATNPPEACCLLAMCHTLSLSRRTLWTLALVTPHSALVPYLHKHKATTGSRATKTRAPFHRRNRRRHQAGTR